MWYGPRCGTFDGIDFRFTALNVYNSDGSCGAVVDLDEARANLGSGKAAVRAWFSQNMATTGGTRDWTQLDQTLATAEGRDVKVIGG